MAAPPLSPRQSEIVLLVGRDGKSWKAVARLLEIHPSTVRNHVDVIRERTGCQRAPREAMVEVYWRVVMGKNGTWAAGSMDGMGD